MNVPHAQCTINVRAQYENAFINFIRTTLKHFWMFLCDFVIFISRDIIAIFFMGCLVIVVTSQKREYNYEDFIAKK